MQEPAANDTAYGIRTFRMPLKQLGADGLLLQVTPYYNKASQRGLGASTSTAIAGSVKIPMHPVQRSRAAPACNILPLTPTTSSAKAPNIVATKEASRDISALHRDRVSLCGDDLDGLLRRTTTQADADRVPSAARASSPRSSNLMPKEMHELATASVAGDLKTAQALALLSILDLDERTVHGRQPNPGKAGIEPDGLQLRPLPLAACRYVR